MKANELMVGDWVYAIDANGEKHPCRANNLEYDYTNKLGDFCVDFYGTGYEAEWPDVAFNVEPIPITPEILEKSGFKRVRDKLGRVFYSIADDYFDLTIDEITDSIWCIEYDNLEAQFPTCRNLVAHVHELQHALRLCGIDKEIVL